MLDPGLLASLHFSEPSSVVEQMWLLSEQSAFVTQASLQPTAGVGAGAAAGGWQLRSPGFIANLQVPVDSSQICPGSPV